MVPVDVTIQGRQPVLVRWREPAPDAPTPAPAAGAAPAGGRPHGAHDAVGRLHRTPVTRVLDRWRYDGRWWECEVHRDYLLLELRGGAVVELFREGDAWWVARVSD